MSPLARVVLVVVVLGVAALLGQWWRSRNGRFTPVPERVREAAGRPEPPHADRLTPADLGAPLGARAPFLQLSSEVCAPCRRTHVVLAALAAERHDVSHVDLDVADRLDLVRRFDVMRTPTVLLLDGSGAVVGRMSGSTDRRQALDALETLPDGSFAG